MTGLLTSSNLSIKNKQINHIELARLNRYDTLYSLKLIRIYFLCYLFSLYATSISLAYAQREIQSNISGDTYTMRNSTNGTSLDVQLQTLPYPIKVNQEQKFTVSFLKPGNDTLQDHVDFNLKIIRDNKQVFQATNQTGQPNIPLAE